MATLLNRISTLKSWPTFFLLTSSVLFQRDRLYTTRMKDGNQHSSVSTIEILGSQVRGLLEVNQV